RDRAWGWADRGRAAGERAPGPGPEWDRGGAGPRARPAWGRPDRARSCSACTPASRWETRHVQVRLNPAASGIPPYPMSELAALAERLRSEGRNVYDFGI